MASLWKGVQACRAIARSFPKPCVLTENAKRTIIPDPEEELETLKITKSFESKVSKAGSHALPVNIGLPYHNSALGRRARLEKWQQRKELEPLARHRKLVIDFKDLERDHALESGPEHARSILEHYSIFSDLFQEHAYFYPLVNMDISFDYDDATVTPVYLGNRVIPHEARGKPTVSIGKRSDLSPTYCLLLTSLDGHLHDDKSEYLHWFVGNVSNGDINSGQELCTYLQPIPPRGTGFHRYAFVLFQQEGLLDFDKVIQVTTGKLSERTFSTAKFFKNYAGKLTPVGVNFFQTQWDESVRDTFYNVLDMKEPAYEYDFPEPYHPSQIVFPHRQPFNVYLDRYRDRKDIREQALKEKLKNLSPFGGEKQEWKYPAAVPYRRKDQPASWLKQQIHNKRLKRNLWKYANNDD